ncbi:phosphoribosylaminoimidazole carboxylase, ATPase subunit, partial [Phytophthora nicotianae]
VLAIRWPINAAQTPRSSKINMPVLTTNASGAVPPVVGVLGGGQLGRMMANAAHRLGLQVLVLDPLGADSPAGQTGLKAVAGSFTKEEDIAKLAEQCDVLTVEIEHVNAAFLQQLQDKKEANVQGVHPAPATIALIQDKYQQKQFFTQVQGVDVAPYEIVTSLQAARQVGERFGYPYMLKSRRFAYDGKGNAVVKSEKDLVDAFEKLGAKLLAKEGAGVDLKELAEEEAKLYAEKWVPFVKELAVMVVKGAEGDVRAYPVVETTQRDSICDTVLAPAQIPVDVAKRAGEMAEAAVAQLDGRGIYGVELFLTATGEVLLNEIAPRPHNSGHYTIEACETDQFEQHLRAITGLPLGSCALRVPAALMVNVLGDATSSEDVSFSLLRNSLNIPGAAAHFYGKAGVRPGRKLGHVTITAPSLEELSKRATALSPEAAKNSGLLKQERKPLVGIVMGSDSDLPSMAAAADMLEKFGVPYELTIVSAHRTPARMYEYAQNAAGRGLKVIIAGAGGAAHLPGMIAALTPLPVVGVPVKTSTLNGEDSLLSIVQMPRGVPVATVAIGNSTNAGLLAVRILGAGDSSLIDAMATFLDTQKREVDDKIEKMAASGWKEYLQNMKKH